jgi:hypothetical protein
MSDSLHYPMLWAFLFVLVAAIECYALGTGHSEYTLSYAVRLARFDPIGRFVVVPLMCWLLVHFIIAPKWVGTHFDWRNAVGLGLGVVIAVLETIKAAR